MVDISDIVVRSRPLVDRIHEFADHRAALRGHRDLLLLIA
jgi:hypothetical protein